MSSETYTPIPETTDTLARRVIGCAIEVHRHLGPGFLESIYHNAFKVELEQLGLSYESEKAVTVTYKGRKVGRQRVDLVVGDAVLVEIKSAKKVRPIHRAQVISYLKATGLRLGLLINFRVDLLRHGIKRIVV